MTIASAVTDVLTPPLRAVGVHLEDVIITPAGRRRVVRVIVDTELPDADEVTGPVRAMTLDDIADATRVVADVLDDTDVLGEQPYTLEVSSPGVGRPLRLRQHYQRAVTRLVRLTPRVGGPVSGRLLRAGRSDLTLQVIGAKGAAPLTGTYAYADLLKGEVQVEFAAVPDEATGVSSAETSKES